MPAALTKIVITLGPASVRPDILPKLIEAGASVMRLNFSHGTTEQRLSYLKAVRELSGPRPIAIMGDLCGPKIRIGLVENEGILVRAGDTVTLQRESILGRDNVLSTNLPTLVDDVQVGQRVLIDDGMIRMLIVAKERDRIMCQVTTGGIISSNKGLNLPNTALNVPCITDKDWKDVDFAIEHGLDYVALSFVRTAAEVRELRAYLDKRGSKMGVVSKIEKPEAITNLLEVVDASDAVLVARGDLGVELDLTAVPLMQKQIVACCQEAGKPVIVATQMLQSMIDNASPTRAEVSDVANAILDGADAVMLSGETAVGKYPIGAVLVLSEIAKHTEEHILKSGASTTPPKLLRQTHHRTAAIAHGAQVVAQDVDAKLLAVWSQAGGSARYISKNRIGVPILALSNDAGAVRRMALYHGVTPRQAEVPQRYGQFAELIDRMVQEEKLAVHGDRVVIVAGAPMGIVGVTNSLSVHTVGK